MWLAQYLADGIRAWVQAEGPATVASWAEQGRDVVRRIADAYGPKVSELPVPVQVALRVVLRTSRAQLAAEVLATVMAGSDEAAQIARAHQAWVHDHLLRLGNLLWLRLTEGTRHGYSVEAR